LAGTSHYVRKLQMAALTRIVGSYLSPYVRKVLACLHLKNVTYEIDPIVPFYGNDEFGRISPVRRIPVLIDDEVTLSDSTVICEYLEDRYPSPRLLPEGIAQRARSRWYEEFADTRMGEVFIWHLYNQVVIRKFVWGEAPDQVVLGKAMEEEIPSVLDYLEGELPPSGFLFGPVGIADLSIATFFRNAGFARYQIDRARAPRTAAYVERVLALPAFQQLVPFEQVCLRTPIQQHRAALAEAGAPISPETFGTAEPRRGILSI
jgi:glutathione S-transferase